MKSLILSALVLSITGCAGPAGQQFMKNFGEGMQYQAQMQQQQAQQNQQNLQTYMHNNPVRQTDNQCFQACTQAGYQYGLCQSKCSY